MFVRPGELRAAEWSEMVLDGDEPLRRIPAERMKMREADIVPLARQSVDILRALQPIIGASALCFPCNWRRRKADERKYFEWRNPSHGLFR
jgi:integrase